MLRAFLKRSFAARVREPTLRAMLLRLAALLIPIVLVGCSPVEARTRSTAAKQAFQRAEPCPANGARRGPCKGFVIDHVQPLCAGGADSPANMQWQTRREAAAKDVEERRACRALKRG